MKIYEIGTGYTPIPAQVAAATESVVEELTKSYIGMDQPVEIIDISAPKRAKHNLPITEVSVPSFFTKEDVSLGIVHKIKRVVYSVALAYKLKRILKNENEKAVLHFHNQYNLFFFLKLVPKKLRAKALVAYTNHNGMWSKNWNDVKDLLYKRYFQEIFSMKNADQVFVLNEETRKNVIEQLGIEAERVIKISNGVNTDIYCPISQSEIEETKKKYKINGKKVILQVGSVYENKGQARAVEMLSPLLKKHDELIYAYVGGIVSQEYSETVRKTAESLGVSDKVVYLGTAVPGTEMNRLYNIADITFFASEYEGFPLVCIESVSAGVPVVICSDINIDLGPGCIVTSKEKTESDIEKKVFSCYDEYKKLCLSARENAENNYSWQKIARKYLTAFIEGEN
ncbi:MAG: glycosyltransferase family 4 protein [Clostridia bacterium]|nr:glycosyltransferase family 4 protein [Clostridia bacterium]